MLFSGGSHVNSSDFFLENFNRGNLGISLKASYTKAPYQRSASWYNYRFALFCI